MKCPKCGGTGWTHDNSGLPDGPCPECAARGYMTTQCDLCGEFVPDELITRLGDTAVCQECKAERE